MPRPKIIEVVAFRQRLDAFVSNKHLAGTNIIAAKQMATAMISMIDWMSGDSIEGRRPADIINLVASARVVTHD